VENQLFHELSLRAIKTSKVRLGSCISVSLTLLSFTAGTNIDDAIQTGSSLLRDYLSGPDSSPNSVSLIIFLTDGRPTVGEVQSTSILGNARSAVQEKFCIFTIGIGNDVDYRLLERMALDNCGMMRRIHEDADASAMLKGYIFVSDLCFSVRSCVDEIFLKSQDVLYFVLL